MRSSNLSFVINWYRGGFPEGLDLSFECQRWCLLRVPSPFSPSTNDALSARLALPRAAFVGWQWKCQKTHQMTFIFFQNFSGKHPPDPPSGTPSQKSLIRAGEWFRIVLCNRLTFPWISPKSCWLFSVPPQGERWYRLPMVMCESPGWVYCHWHVPVVYTGSTGGRDGSMPVGWQWPHQVWSEKSEIRI